MLTPWKTPAVPALVFLLEADNALLDNDRFVADLDYCLEQQFGAYLRYLYWTTLAKLREELGYTDHLGALQAIRGSNHPDLHRISAFLLEYPFEQRLHPRTLEAIAYLHTLGQPVVLSGGDEVLDPHKLQRSGICSAVRGRVLTPLDGSDALVAAQLRYPARHYVMVDSKPQLLAAMKRVLATKLTTVFVRQGSLALALERTPEFPPPDVVITQIGELIDFDLARFGVARHWAPLRPQQTRSRR